VEGYPGGSRLTRIPGRVLPVQPGLAMEQACELGTPFRYLHRLDKEFQLMGRFFNWVIFLVNWLCVRGINSILEIYLEDPQLQALEWEQDLLLLIGM
jgi:hypothetical protein